MRKNPTAWNANELGRNWHLDVAFGLHYDLHANAEDTELGAALTHEHLRAELEKVRPDWVQCDCKGHAGYTSWPTAVGSTSPGVVRDALRIHRDVTREMGIPLVMHYSGVFDARALELHPGWAAVQANGEPYGVGMPGAIRPICTLGPYVDALMIPQLLEIIDNYDVDGFWVDGDAWAACPCYCERCTSAFTAQTGIREIPKQFGEAHWDAWSDFHRHNFEAYVRKYAEAVHARKPSCLVCSNWMYTSGHPSEINAPVDYLSGDFSWAWGTDRSIVEGRAMDSRGLSWNLMAWGFTTTEQGMQGWVMKPAAHLCQEAATVLALGGAMQVYDQPQRNGHLTNWRQDILAEVARFVRARQPWCTDTESVPQVAVLNAASHVYHTVGQLMPAGGNANPPVLGALVALLENHCQVDVLTETALIERIDAYPLVVIPEQTHLSPALKEALAAYVRGGGKLILTGNNVAADFADLAGVQTAGEPQDGYLFLPVGREATIVKGPWQPVALVGAEMLQPVMTQQEPERNASETPGVTLHRVGEGCVLAVHSLFFSFFSATRYPRSRALVGEWLARLAPDFLVSMDAPARLHLSLRRKETQLIAHLVNMGTAHPTSPTQSIVEEVPPVGPVTLRVQLAAPPKAVYLAPRMEGVDWVWADGQLTVQVTSVGILDSVVIEKPSVG